ncbi:MAG: Mammalian cell entry related domain protein [Marmoricola sp.]|nr:Mammalian cell entry related domain protein [Marmoricola sp.]
MAGRPTAVIVAGAVVLAGVGIVALRGGGGGYEVQVVMPAATNLVKGSQVQVNGAPAGSVAKLQAKDGKAVVTLKLKSSFAPLHDGTTARISWKALLGERIVDLTAGPSKNAKLPNGALIEGSTDRVELDQVLAALDAPTRAALQSLLARLDTTLSGSQSNLQSTLQSAGPAVQALGQVLEGIGSDGPAIRTLVTRLHQMSSIVQAKDASVSSTISHLTSSVNVVAASREALQQVLAELPGTIDQADTTLDKVPSTVQAALPLLADLKPATARLPAVARELSPVLQDLRPAVAELEPTLGALDQLLGETPGLLAGLSSVVPQLKTAGTNAEPAIKYLRPYTPELAGWLSNWGSAAANYDSNGHYLRAFVEEGTTSVNVNPGILPPGITKTSTRLPGEAEGQPWTDANGSGLQ